MSGEHFGAGDPLFANKYRFLRPLGKGAMGDVWLAEEEGPLAFRRKVAIKLLHSSLESFEGAAQSFIAEAQVIARIDHPNVVRLIELGSTEAGVHLVLDFNDGPALNRIIKKAGALSPKVVAYLGREVARALEAVHSMCDEEGRPCGTVHRDVSPSNILVSREGQVRLTDFGIARISGSGGDRTMTGVVKGKLAYMPPEQARCEPFDGSADIFSLGVTLFEALLGGPLRRAETQAQLIMMVATERVAKVHELRADAPVELAHAIDRATEFNASARYRNAAELGHDLDDVLRAFGPRAEQEARRELKEIAEKVGASSAGTASPNSPRGRPMRPGLPAVPFSSPSSRSLPAMPSSSPSSQTDPGEGAVRQTSSAPGVGPSTNPSGVGSARDHAPHSPRSSPAPSHTLASAILITGRASPRGRAKLMLWVLALGTLFGVGGARFMTFKQTSTEAIARPPSSLVAASAAHDAPPRDPPTAAPAESPIAATSATSAASSASASAPAGSGAPTPPTSPTPPERKAANAAGPAPRRAPPARAASDAEPGANGTLQVVVLPWAEVSVNGRAFGTTPIAPLSLPSGTHSVVVQNPELGVVRSVSVNVEPGKRAFVRLDLRRATE